MHRGDQRHLGRFTYKGRFFKYPLETWDALSQLGLFQSAACMLSYLAARVRPNRIFAASRTPLFLYRAFFSPR